MMSFDLDYKEFMHTYFITNRHANETCRSKKHTKKLKVRTQSVWVASSLAKVTQVTLNMNLQQPHTDTKGSCEDMTRGRRCLLSLVNMGETKKGSIHITNFRFLWIASVASSSSQNCHHHFTTAICTFTCVCLQTAVLHAAPDSHGPVYGGFPLSQECNVTLWSQRLAHTRTHTHELPQHSKAVNTSINRQPRESCKQSWYHANICILGRAGSPHQRSHRLSNPGEETHYGDRDCPIRIVLGWEVGTESDMSTTFTTCTSHKLSSLFITKTKGKLTHWPQDVVVRGGC